MRTHWMITLQSRSLLLIAGLAWIAPAPVIEAAAPAHAHPEKGPHGGPLLELGDEEFHLEVILDEKQNLLTLHVLDGSAKAIVPIEAPELLVNLKHSGKPVQYRLKAVTEKGESAEGPTATFQLKSGSLIHALHHKGHGARVVVRIKGRSYTTGLELAHDHDHKH